MRFTRNAYSRSNALHPAPGPRAAKPTLGDPNAGMWAKCCCWESLGGGGGWAPAGLPVAASARQIGQEECDLSQWSRHGLQKVWPQRRS